MKRVRELDGLRVFAILAVIAVHYRPPFRPTLDLLSLGWAGVDLFFVISGFLITTNLVSLRGTRKPYRLFYWRRALRIFPPYYLVLLLLTLYPVVRNGGQRVDLHLGSWLFLDSLRNLHRYCASIRLALNGNFLTTQLLPLGNYVFSNYKDGFTVFWSLSVEEIFYLIWAPIVLRCSRRSLLGVSLVALFVCPVLRVLCHGSQWEFFFFPCRFDTLMMGGLLSLLVIAVSRAEIRRSLLVRCLWAAATASLLCLVPLCLHDGLLRHIDLRSALSFTAFGYSLLGLLFASIVGLCVLHSESAAWWCRLLRTRPMVYIGTVSYMMYMVHIPVWVTIYKIFCRVEGRAIAPGLAIGLLSMVGTVALAAISWRFFESPILSFKNASFPVPRRAPVHEGETLHPPRRVRRLLIGSPPQSLQR